MDLLGLAPVCAPAVHHNTLARLVQRESNFQPLAINLNGGLRLQRQPRNLAEAVATARELMRLGIDFDAGLAQINIKNWPSLGLDPVTVFDPCRNLKAAQDVLIDCFRRAPARDPQAAALKALSCFNTGNHRDGFRNGYVTRVVNAPPAVPSSFFINHWP